MKKFRVQFWLVNGNHYSWFVKASDYDTAMASISPRLYSFEPECEVNEIAIHCVKSR